MKANRILSLLLATLCVCFLAACTTTAATTQAPTVAPTVAPTEAATIAPTASAAPATTDSGAAGSLPITADKTTMTALVGSSLSDANTVVQYLEQITNVHLDMTVIPTDNEKEKINLLLSSGDYPEIILSPKLFTNQDLVKYGTQEKILIPLNDLIDKYAVNLKARWSEDNAYKLAMTTPDGNIYGIPSCDSGSTGHGAVQYTLWMTTAWLTKLNLKSPTTTEEFKAVLEAFKKRDPNGNGKADEIPLTGAINTWAADPYLFLLNAFDYYDGDTLLKLKDGTFTFCANTDGFKEGLSYIADLYTVGLIDPAAFTQDNSQMQAIGNNPDIAIAGAATCGHLGMFLDINTVDRSKQYDDLLPLKGSNGYQGIPYAKNVVLSGASFVITDKCTKPEVAIKWADLFCSEDIAIRAQVGVKGKEWDAADSGTVTMDGKTTAAYKYLNYSGDDAANDKWGWTLRLIEPNWKNKFQVVGDIYDPNNYEARLYQATIKMLPYAAAVDQIPAFYMNEDTSAELSTVFASLNDYVKNSIVEFITGKKSVDKDWNQYLAGLSSLKVDRYVQIYQDAYNALAK